MSFFIKNKSVLGLLFLSLAAMFGYNYFAETPETTPSGEQAALIGADLLDISAKLSAARLDTKIFGEGLYTFLSDFSAPLPSQSIGRKNPFNLIGRE